MDWMNVCFVVSMDRHFHHDGISIFSSNIVSIYLQEYTRVWLLCELRVSPLLPQFITDYAASRAMPRATTWIKPVVEAAATLWLKKTDTTS